VAHIKGIKHEREKRGERRNRRVRVESNIHDEEKMDWRKQRKISETQTTQNTYEEKIRRRI